MVASHKLPFYWTLWVYLVCHAVVPAHQRHMHSYREAFEEMDGGAVSPTPTAGGEVFPQTPAFPISPQTPYFNLCKFSLWLSECFVELTLGPSPLLTNYCVSLLLK